MARARLSTCLVAACLTYAVVLHAQNRPGFNGTWTLVVEKSVPATPESHGREITIKQDGQVITLTQNAFRPATATAAREDGTSSMTYETDGAEHPTPAPIVSPNLTASSPATLPPGARVTTMGPADSTYRAIWTRDQLVIMTRSVLRITPPPAGYVPANRVSRKALSLDADGLLAVDSITLTDPAPGSATQATPVGIHSVYRKAS